MVCPPGLRVMRGLSSLESCCRPFCWCTAGFLDCRGRWFLPAAWTGQVSHESPRCSNAVQFERFDSDAMSARWVVRRPFGEGSRGTARYQLSGCEFFEAVLTSDGVVCRGRFPMSSRRWWSEPLYMPGADEAKEMEKAVGFHHAYG